MPPNRYLIAAGPTREPIDPVRYIGNRSSGRLGIALADAAARRGHATTLLLGPSGVFPSDPSVLTERFERAEELERLIRDRLHDRDIFIMAAAVADYRPRTRQADKIRREGPSLTIELEQVPDILAGLADVRRPHQLIVGFALEPRSKLLESAQAKLERKQVDMIVANPLETMDATTIEALLIRHDAPPESVGSTHAPLDKQVFASMLIDRCDALLDARADSRSASP
ncbi:MAG: phosphopantothenoylcysteine decarboxylase [Planctomycetota bacterium]